MIKEITIVYSCNKKVKFKVLNEEYFEKNFKRFCKSFNKFIEGSGLVDISKYFTLNNSQYVSTKNVINIYCTDVPIQNNSTVKNNKKKILLEKGKKYETNN